MKIWTGLSKMASSSRQDNPCHTYWQSPVPGLVTTDWLGWSPDPGVTGRWSQPPHWPLSSGPQTFQHPHLQQIISLLRQMFLTLLSIITEQFCSASSTIMQLYQSMSMNDKRGFTAFAINSIARITNNVSNRRIAQWPPSPVHLNSIHLPQWCRTSG